MASTWVGSAGGPIGATVRPSADFISAAVRLDEKSSARSVASTTRSQRETK
ncbi:Uncharacterised protein [Mycobacteroides abscessus subsp. abscessus]|nr:Uncharacterised protein [Mycobacteroides abscessus subsp. abscessus]